MADGLDPARALMPGVRLKPVDTLSQGERSTVRRAQAVDAVGREFGVIVKQFHDAGQGWQREAAALASVPDAVRVSRLFAVGVEPPILVTEDLGAGPSLADALAGTDPAAAESALIGWAQAVAELHVATLGARVEFSRALGRLGEQTGTEPVESWMPARLRDAERILDRVCGSLEVRLPSGALEELTGLTERLGGEGLAALTPADTCPENNVRVGDRYVLVDFEGAQWRHLAWDVAYLHVPWPTCPCAWRLPQDVADRATEAYRRAASTAFPGVGHPAFDADVEAAVVGWSMMTVTWFLEHALGTPCDSEPEPVPVRPSPSRRAVILHRLGRAARSEELPAVSELATELRAALADRWGDLPLALAPAFARG
ncbi:MAG: hypothetical protein ABI345_04290 [Jatrophihabitans sp.]